MKRKYQVLSVITLLVLFTTACSTKDTPASDSAQNKITEGTQQEVSENMQESEQGESSLSLTVADVPQLSRVYYTDSLFVSLVDSNGTIRYEEKEPIVQDHQLTMLKEMEKIDDAVSLLWADISIVYLNDKGEVIYMDLGLKRTYTLLSGITKPAERFRIGKILYGITEDGSLALNSEESGSYHPDMEEIEGWDNLEKIVGGYTTVVALKKDGSVLAAGDNYGGRLDEVNTWTNMKDIDLYDERDHLRYGLNDGSHCCIAGVNEDGTIRIAGPCFYADRFSHITNAEKISLDKSCAAVLKSDGTVEVVVRLGYGENCEANKWTDIVEVRMEESMVHGVKADGTLLFAHQNGLRDDGTEWFPGDRKLSLK